MKRIYSIDGTKEMKDIAEMRIAIVTITDGQNYGNRLQNLALQETLKSMGFKVETIRRKTYRDLSFSAKIKQSIKNTIKKSIGRKYGAHRALRKKRFDQFNRKNIRFSKICLHDNTAPKSISEKYDYFVVGSDQVWNAGFKIISDDLKNNLLWFAHPIQRIAYAASFGTDFLSEGSEELFRSELPKFKSISVREKTGVDLVRSCGMTAKVTLDPVMLLSNEQWMKYAQKPAYVKSQPFILTYFLSDRDKRIDEYCFSLSQGMSIYELNNESIDEDNVKDIEQYCTTPDEFVWLIANAEMVLTDSFHAVAFSILFHKPFWVFERKAINTSYKMGGRISTLLDVFNLSNHRRSLDDSVEKPEVFDGEAIDSILSEKREESLRFLKEALL